MSDKFENGATLKGDEADERINFADNYRKLRRQQALKKIVDERRRDLNTFVNRNRFIRKHVEPVGSFIRMPINSLVDAKRLNNAPNVQGSGNRVSNNIFKKALKKREKDFKILEMKEEGVDMTPAAAAKPATATDAVAPSGNTSILTNLIDDLESDIFDARLDEITKKDLKAIFIRLQTDGLQATRQELINLYQTIQPIIDFNSRHDILALSKTILVEHIGFMLVVLLGTLNFGDSERKQAVKNYANTVVKLKTSDAIEDLKNDLIRDFKLKSNIPNLNNYEAIDYDLYKDRLAERGAKANINKEEAKQRQTKIEEDVSLLQKLLDNIIDAGGFEKLKLTFIQKIKDWLKKQKFKETIRAKYKGKLLNEKDIKKRLKERLEKLKQEVKRKKAEAEKKRADAEKKREETKKRLAEARKKRAEERRRKMEEAKRNREAMEKFREQMEQQRAREEAEPDLEKGDVEGIDAKMAEDTSPGLRESLKDVLKKRQKRSGEDVKASGMYRGYGSLHDMLIGLVKNANHSVSDFKKVLRKHKNQLKKAEMDDLLKIKKGLVKGGSSKSVCDTSISDTIKRATQEYWTSNTKRRQEFLFRTKFEGIDDMDIKTILFYHKYKKTPKPLQGGKYSELENSVLFNKNSNNGGMPTKTLIYLANKLGEASFKSNAPKKKVVEYLVYVLYLRGGKTKFNQYLTPKKSYKKRGSKVPDNCSSIRNLQLDKSKNCEPPINYKKTLLKIHPDKVIPECKQVATDKTAELNNLCGRDGTN